MCGRFTQAERIDRIAELFGAEPDPGLPGPSWNVAPTDPITVVLERDDRRVATMAGWGFRPFWRDDPRQPGWINARSETAAESSAFGPALRAHRCVIPADAFYEWDRSHRPPQPYAIGRVDRAPLVMAGIWTRTADAITAAILTTGPNATMRSLHDRMPVILAADAIEPWLVAGALEEVAPLLVPAPDDVLHVWPVSTTVNNVRNNGPHLLEPAPLPMSLDLA